MMNLVQNQKTNATLIYPPIFVGEIDMLAHELKMNLKSFGLNPDEWEIKSLSDEAYLILNLEDNSFRFIGQTIHNKWSFIQLLEE